MNIRQPNLEDKSKIIELLQLSLGETKLKKHKKFGILNMRKILLELHQF